MARFLVYVVLPNGEMVADSTELYVAKCFPNQVRGAGLSVAACLGIHPAAGASQCLGLSTHSLIPKPSEKSPPREVTAPVPCCPCAGEDGVLRGQGPAWGGAEAAAGGGPGLAVRCASRGSQCAAPEARG